MQKNGPAVVGIMLFLVVMLVFQAIPQLLQYTYARIFDVSDSTFYNVLRVYPKVLLEICQPGCSHCAEMDAHYRKAALVYGLLYGDRLVFARMSAADNNIIPSHYNVHHYPSFLLFKYGKLVAWDRGPFIYESTYHRALNGLLERWGQVPDPADIRTMRGMSTSTFDISLDDIPSQVGGGFMSSPCHGDTPPPGPF